MITYVVKSITSISKNKQIGKTFLQKIFYCLQRENIVDLSYTLYHYGPYSTELSRELNLAENMKYLSIEWKDNKGYFIKTTNYSKQLEDFISNDEKKLIDELVKKYVDFSAVDISILTTAFYLKDEYGIKSKNVAQTVNQLKPEYNIDYITSVLQKTDLK